MKTCRAALASFLVGACATGPARAQDSIRIAGAPRMEPMVRALAKAYAEKHPNVAIDITTAGSSTAIQSMINGHASVAMLARPAAEAERNLLRAARREELVGFPVAMDAVVVVVAPENPLDAVSLAKIQAIFTYKVTTWDELGVTRDAFPARVPGHVDELLINRHLPNRNNASVVVLERVASRGKHIAVSPYNYNGIQELMQAVSADPFGIGFGSRSYTEGVKVLPVKASVESPVIYPSPAALRDRSYPLAHYVYFYFPGQPKGIAADFLEFVVSAEGQRVIAESDTGLVTLPLIGGPTG